MVIFLTFKGYAPLPYMSIRDDSCLYLQSALLKALCSLAAFVCFAQPQI